MSEFIFGVDLDGVCADYNEAFRLAVARHRGIDPAELTTEVTWDFAEWGLDREGVLEHHARAVAEDGLFRHAPPIEGVSEALWRSRRRSVDPDHHPPTGQQLVPRQGRRRHRVVARRLHPVPRISASSGKSPRWRPMPTWRTLPTTLRRCGSRATP
ncbi:MAG: hypothetical protein R2789_10335 [Microthrixaceae bacterium]